MLQVIISPAKQMRAAQDAFEVWASHPLCARRLASIAHC